MDAYVSGQAGIAAILRDDDILVKHADNQEYTYRAHLGELGHLFQGCSDVKLIQSENEEGIVEVLDFSYRADRAMRLSYILLDPYESMDIRIDAAEVPDKLLSDRLITEIRRRANEHRYQIPLADKSSEFDSHRHKYTKTLQRYSNSPACNPMSFWT